MSGLGIAWTASYKFTEWVQQVFAFCGKVIYNLYERKANKRFFSPQKDRNFSTI